MIANRVYALETGSIAMSGDASVLVDDDKVKKAYLGDRIQKICGHSGKYALCLN